MRETIAGVDAKLPQLNEEKKAAVAERKFKEAGRLTSELKRLTDQREEADRELSTLLSAIDAAEADAAVQGSELDGRRAALAAHEKETELARMAVLRQAICALRRNLRRLGRAARSRAGSSSRATFADDVDALGRKTASAAVAASAAVETPTGPDPEVDKYTDGFLGIDMDSSGKTPAQTAALELLAGEKDVLMDELNQLCGKHGQDLDLPVETESEDEATAGVPTPPQSELATPRTPTLEPAPAAAAAVAVAAAVAAAAAAAAASSSVSAPRSAPSSPGHDAAASDADAPSIDDDAAAAAGAVAGATGSSAYGADEVSEAGACGELGGADAESNAERAEEALAALAGGIVGTKTAVSGEGAGALDANGGAGAAAAPEPVQVSAEEAAAARAAELSSIARAVLSVSAAIKEKEEVISDAVSREDYDTADAAQADIDSMQEHRERLRARAAELGVTSDEDLAAFFDVAGSAAAAATEPSAAASSVSGPSAFGFLAGDASASSGNADSTGDVAVPAALAGGTGFSFLAGGGVATADTADAISGAGAVSDSSVASALPFIASSAVEAAGPSALPFINAGTAPSTAAAPASASGDDTSDAAAAASSGFSFLTGGSN